MLIRTSKDKKNPYVMINKSVFEDPNLSLKAKGLLGYCLSKPDGWHFNVHHLASVLKEGKQAIYSGFNELIENGYCVREQAREEQKGTFSKINYVLYESSQQPENTHRQASDSKSKKAETLSENPHTENPDAVVVAAVSYKDLRSNKERSNKEEIYKSEPPNEAVIGLTNYFFESLKKLNPKLKTPNMGKWQKEIDRMMRIDLRTEDEIRGVIDYLVWQHENATTDFRWSYCIASPVKLREKFHKLWLQMTNIKIKQESKTQENKQVNIAQENHIWTKHLFEKVKIRLEANGSIKFVVSDNCLLLGQYQGSQYPIAYSESGFQDKVKSYLYKHKII